MGLIRIGTKLTLGAMAAGVAILSPRLEMRTGDAKVQPRTEEAGVVQSPGFRLPTLINSAHATMHHATIANLPTVLRFKATIMTKSVAEIDNYMNSLFREAKLAQDSGDSKRILRSTRQLMIMNEALRDRVAASAKACPKK